MGWSGVMSVFAAPTRYGGGSAAAAGARVTSARPRTRVGRTGTVLRGVPGVSHSGGGRATVRVRVCDLPAKPQAASYLPPAPTGGSVVNTQPTPTEDLPVHA